jgi:hypothetical protein
LPNFSKVGMKAAAARGQVNSSSKVYKLEEPGYALGLAGRSCCYMGDRSEGIIKC